MCVSKLGQKNEFALLFRDCETNKSTVEEIKEAGGLGRKAMSIMVMVMVMVMILIVSIIVIGDVGPQVLLGDSSAT